MKYGHFGKVGKSETPRKKLRGINGQKTEQRFTFPKRLANVTYYSVGRGDFAGCSLRVEMTWPDSLNDFGIENISMGGRQMEIK